MDQPRGGPSAQPNYVSQLIAGFEARSPKSAPNSNLNDGPSMQQTSSAMGWSQQESPERTGRPGTIVQSSSTREHDQLQSNANTSGGLSINRPSSAMGWKNEPTEPLARPALLTAVSHPMTSGSAPTPSSALAASNYRATTATASHPVISVKPSTMTDIPSGSSRTRDATDLHSSSATKGDVPVVYGSSSRDSVFDSSPHNRIPSTQSSGHRQPPSSTTDVGTGLSFNSRAAPPTSIDDLRRAPPSHRDHEVDVSSGSVPFTRPSAPQYPQMNPSKTQPSLSRSPSSAQLNPATADTRNVTSAVGTYGLPHADPRTNVTSNVLSGDSRMASNAQDRNIPSTSASAFQHPKLAELLSSPYESARQMPSIPSSAAADSYHRNVNMANQAQQSRIVSSEASPSNTHLSKSKEPNDRTYGDSSRPQSSRSNLNGKPPSPATQSLNHRTSPSKVPSHTPPSPAFLNATSTPPPRQSPSSSSLSKAQDTRLGGLAHAAQDTPSSHASHRGQPAVTPPKAYPPSVHHMNSQSSIHPLNNVRNMYSDHSQLNDTHLQPRNTQNSYPSSTVYQSQPSYPAPSNTSNVNAKHSTSDTPVPLSLASTSAMAKTKSASAWKHADTLKPQAGASSSSAIHPSISTRPLPKSHVSSTSRNHEPPAASNQASSRVDTTAYSVPQPFNQAPTRPQQSVTVPIPPDVYSSSRSGQNPSIRPAPPTQSSQSHATTQYLHPNSAASQPQKVSRIPSEESLLMTPSSLAPSMLKPSISRSSIPASVSSSQQETRKKGGFLGMFRSKASQQPPPPPQPQQPTPQAYEVWNPPGRDPPRAKNGPPKRVTLPPESDTKPLSSRVKAPPPIEIPNQKPSVSERKSPNSKVFTPFRYLTSKRNRTMSAASAEAVDGTAVSRTV